MPSISGLSFSVKFDLTSTPLLVVTDTSTTPPTGFKAFMTITLPDGYNYTGNLISPDIPSAGSVFSTTLRLGSDGYVQNGTYTIVMTGNATGYDDTTFTRTFTISFPSSSVSIREDFDVFTPELFLTDITNYNVAGYTTGTLTRSWSVSSVPTGTITGTGVTLDLIYSGHYYDAYYNIVFSATSLYTHSTYSWFTVAKKYSKSYTTYARTPDTISTIIGLIDTLKYAQDSNGECCCHDDFPYAQSLLDHIIQKYLSGDTIGLSTDLSQLLALLHNNITPVYSPLNTIINTYNWSTIVPGGGSTIWGGINGTLANQTDLQAALNAKQPNIALTTTGSSGAATFVSNILNIPQYSISGIGGTPSTRTITINGVAFDLSSDRSWTISEVDTLNSVTTRGNTTTNGITVGSSTILGATTAQLSIRPTTNNIGEIIFQNAGYGAAKWTIRAIGSADGSSGDFTFQRSSSTFPVTIKESENVLIGTTLDSGYKLLVSGTSYFGTNPNAEQMRVNGRIRSLGTITVDDYLSFGGSTSAQRTIYANSLVINTNNSPTNITGTRYTITQQVPGANTGTGTTDLLYLLLPVNTGTSIANSRGLVIDFSVTSNAGVLTAIEAVQGRIKFGDLSGTGTRMVVADSTGVLSTQAVPTGTGTAITRSINTISTNTTAGSTAYTDYIYFVTGTTTITLPTAVSNTNIYTIKNTGTGTVTVATTSSQNIDDNTTFSITIKNYTIDVISDGTNWKII